MPVDLHYKLWPLYFFVNTTEVFSQKKLRNRIKINIFRPFFIWRGLHKSGKKNVVIIGWFAKVSLRLGFSLQITFFIFFFCFVFDQNFDDEVLVSMEVVVHRMNLKSEILDLFLQKNILWYNLKITLKLPRGNVESGEGEGMVRDVFKQVFNVV